MSTLSPASLGADALLRLQGQQPNAALAAAKAANGQPDSVSARAKTKAHAAAQDFEAVFLSSMFQQMFKGIDGDGPFGGTPGIAVWRSFLADQVGKSMAKRGGIGIAAHVYDSLLKLQGAPTS